MKSSKNTTKGTTSLRHKCNVNMVSAIVLQGQGSSTCSTTTKLNTSSKALLKNWSMAWKCLSSAACQDAPRQPAAWRSATTITTTAKTTWTLSIRGQVSLLSTTGSLPTTTCCSKRRRVSSAMASSKHPSTLRRVFLSCKTLRTTPSSSSTPILMPKNSLNTTKKVASTNLSWKTRR